MQADTDSAASRTGRRASGSICDDRTSGGSAYRTGLFERWTFRSAGGASGSTSGIYRGLHRGDHGFPDEAAAIGGCDNRLYYSIGSPRRSCDVQPKNSTNMPLKNACYISYRHGQHELMKEFTTD